MGFLEFQALTGDNCSYPSICLMYHLFWNGSLNYNGVDSDVEVTNSTNYEQAKHLSMVGDLMMEAAI